MNKLDTWWTRAPFVLKLVIVTALIMCIAFSGSLADNNDPTRTTTYVNK